MRDCPLHFGDFCCSLSILLLLPCCSFYYYYFDRKDALSELIVFLHKKRKRQSIDLYFVFQALKRAKQCASIALQDENLIETSLEFYGKVAQLLLRYVGIRPTE
jgi:hypothetical protein